MNELTHFSESGRARMVDVSGKPETFRTARASGILRMRHATMERIRSGSVAKGDVLAVADVAAVMAAKRTPELIPMCHSLPLSAVDVTFDEIVEPDADGCPGIRCEVIVGCTGPTGVEMEALCAVSTALLTVYDMCKSMDRDMRIESVQLEEKRGGKTGLWQRKTVP